LTANQGFRMPGNLGSVTVPTLVIAGKREYAVMHASAQQLAAALPNGHYRLVDLGKGASMAMEHNWAMTAPDLFTQTVRSFIEDREIPEVIWNKS
jgi:pimeloyl-ACP methyl ester carboxylesterase